MRTELKDKIHNMVNTIEDEETLNQVMEDVAFYASKTDEVGSLSQSQLQELDVAMKEADDNKVVSFEDFKRELDEWKKQS